MLKYLLDMLVNSVHIYRVVVTRLVSSPVWLRALTSMSMCVFTKPQSAAHSNKQNMENEFANMSDNLVNESDKYSIIYVTIVERIFCSQFYTVF